MKRMKQMVKGARRLEMIARFEGQPETPISRA